MASSERPDASPIRAEGKDDLDGAAGSRIVVLGCGSSTGTPQARCVTQGKLGECPACTDAHVNGPESRNKRGNPSVLIQHGGKNIVIDVGKSFREGLRV